MFYRINLCKARATPINKGHSDECEACLEEFQLEVGQGLIILHLDMTRCGPARGTGRGYK